MQRVASRPPCVADSIERERERGDANRGEREALMVLELLYVEGKGHDRVKNIDKRIRSCPQVLSIHAVRVDFTRGN